MGRRQLVEIAKALSADARVLIMDEPTSSLTIGETEALFEVVETLKREGTSVIYISHRLAEVERIADRVEVLRDGCNAGALSREQVDHDALVRLMVGREVDRVFDRGSHARDAVALEVDALHTQANPGHGVSLHVRKGEIVGLAGLVGAGRTELLRALFGLDAPMRGSIRIDGRSCRINAPIEAISAGIALVPEDRKADGLLLEESLRTNAVLPSIRRLASGVFTSPSREGGLARDLIERLHVQTRDERTVVGGLSGGNQQKVVLGKWLARDPEILLLDEPTRGVDVGAKEEIYKLMDQNARDGRAILFASSEMEELLSLADRVYVMHEGRIAGELSAGELDEQRVMHLATGGDRR